MTWTVFQASPSTQLLGEAERDGAAGTRSLPTHNTRTPHESEAVYQGMYRSSVPLRLGYCWPVIPFSQVSFPLAACGTGPNANIQTTNLCVGFCAVIRLRCGWPVCYLIGRPEVRDGAPRAHLGSVQPLLTILIIASGLWFVAMLAYFEAGVPCQVQVLVHSHVDVLPTSRIIWAENPYREPLRCVLFFNSLQISMLVSTVNEMSGINRVATLKWVYCFALYTSKPL